MQELNREANTLSSKAIRTELTRIAVDLKVLIEQMREQVQNIEYTTTVLISKFIDLSTAP